MKDPKDHYIAVMLFVAMAVVFTLLCVALAKTV